MAVGPSEHLNALLLRVALYTSASSTPTTEGALDDATAAASVVTHGLHAWKGAAATSDFGSREHLRALLMRGDGVRACYSLCAMATHSAGATDTRARGCPVQGCAALCTCLFWQPTPNC